MTAARRIGLGVAIAWLGASRPARALDCPCTWESVICQADAVAEVEMHLATKTRPDRMEVRRVIWNRTTHGIRSAYGHPNVPHATMTRTLLLHYLEAYRLEGPHPGADTEWITRWRRALARGSYRSIVFLTYSPEAPWYGGGVATVSEMNWLDHPRHAEWWAKLEPYLEERIAADRRGEKPPFCARSQPSQSRLELE
jgi:hypothetical protein